MKRYLNWDSVIGLAFALLGTFLTLKALAFPEGTGGVPGPGFFPLLVGIILLTLGGSLVAVQGRLGQGYWEKGWQNLPVLKITTVLVLLFVYVWVWDLVPFLARTSVLLLLVYRILGVSWLQSTVVAATVTLALFAIFQWLFYIRL